MIRRLFAAAALAGALGCAARPAPRAADLPSTVDVQILALNDFHGALEPASGSNGRIGQVDAGGVEFLSAHLATRRGTNPNTLTVAAGDLIGASPLLSGMFHDEPAIEALNAAGLDVASVGNHEFDEGWAELYRMQHGGCHPVDGCQDSTPFTGARFQYLAANVTVDFARLNRDAVARTGVRPPATGAPLLFPAFTVREVGGVRIGFIGLVLRATPEIVTAAGITGISFGDEVEAGNAAAAALVSQGVSAIVVLIHQGGVPGGSDINGCDVTGPIVDIATRLSSAVDVVVSGHTHRSYICTIGGKLVTSAESVGRVITDIDLRIDRRTGDVVTKQAENLIVTRDVPKDARQTELIARYRPFYGPLAARPVGTITAPLTRAPNAAGESALGDVVADSYFEAGVAIDSRTVAAFVNIGGLRSDIVGDASNGEAPRTVRYVQAFEALPFGNRVVVRTLTGAAIAQMLEEQFDNPGPGQSKILQVSQGFSYAFDPSRPAGQRIDRASIRIAGHPLDATARYRVVSNDFVWGGGDAFTTARQGTEPMDAGADSDVFIAYLQRHAPVAPGAQNRISRR